MVKDLHQLLTVPRIPVSLVFFWFWRTLKNEYSLETVRKSERKNGSVKNGNVIPTMIV